MSTPPTGPLGVLLSKGDLLVTLASRLLARFGIGAEGEFLRVRAAAAEGMAWEDIEASLGYQLTFGANFPNNNFERWHHVHGEATSSNASGLDPTSEQLAAKAGTLTRIAWNTDTAVGGVTPTQYIIYVNSIANTTVSLTGASGVISSLSITIALGDRVAVSYDPANGGMQPGNSNINLMME